MRKDTKDKFNKKHRKGLCKKKIALLCFFALLFIMSVIYIVQFLMMNKKNGAVYDNIQRAVHENETDESGEDETDSLPDVDFDELKNINQDIYAYIYIPDTKISYPIVQKKDDNEYYLNHTIENASGYPGSIYTENYNTMKFTDRNTLIYGHNMKDGSMFADLCKYSDEDFWNQHRYVYILMPDKILKYQVVAALMFDDRHITTSYDFSSVAGFMEYVNDIKEQGQDMNFDDAIQLDGDSQIITMSTCMPDNRPDNRWLVMAVLMK